MLACLQQQYMHHTAQAKVTLLLVIVNFGEFQPVVSTCGMQLLAVQAVAWLCNTAACGGHHD